MSETELLKSFTEDRSEPAFAELVRRYAGLVYSTAKRRLANPALAEDITQLVFIRLAKNPPRVRTHAQLAAWLHRTTVNVTIDVWRSETRRRARELHAALMEPSDTATVIWEEISPRLDEALNQLKDDDRQAILLRFISQKTMREVGVALGISEDAAKMRVSRAVDRLRTQLGARVAACSAVLLGTLLVEHTAQAAPAPLLAKLSALKLPTATSASTGTILRVSPLKLACGAAALALLIFSVVQFVDSQNASVTTSAPVSQTNLTASATSKSANPAVFGFGPVSPLPTPSIKMWFHVMDAATGGPLPGTKIHSAYFGPGGAGENHDALTDNTGVAAIPDPGDYAKKLFLNVFAVAEGHVPKCVMFKNGVIPKEYAIKLDPAMIADGIVVDDQGQPVSGVKILIEGSENPTWTPVPGQQEIIDFSTCPVTNRDDGTWSCGYLPPDYTNEIRFLLHKDGYAATISVVPVASVGLSHLVLVIERGFTVIGKITDSQNHPIANARLKTLNGDYDIRQSVKTDEQGVFVPMGVSGETALKNFYNKPPLETNADGVVVVRGMVPQGPLHVELAVQADGFTPQTTYVDLPNPTNVVNFTLAPGKIFRGHVIDEAGHPIPNAAVSTDFDFKAQISTQFDWTAHTDRNGRFEWDSAPAGPICYWFEADGYSVIRGLPLLADGADQQITLKHLETK